MAQRPGPTPHTVPQCRTCRTIATTRHSVCQTCGTEIPENVSRPLADHAPLEPLHTTGTITLANGQHRHAKYMTGSFTGRRTLNYRTPAGHWRLASPAEEATFQPTENPT